MRLFSNKVFRLLLAASVSVWMAGGCLFGCANTSMGAEVSYESQNTAEHAPSCHAKKARTKSPVTRNLQQIAGVPYFFSSPHGMMSECPLVVNSTAATSKNSTYSPDSTRDTIAALPGFEKQAEQTDKTLEVSFLPNRGPTHLRCCVFLI